MRYYKRVEIINDVSTKPVQFVGIYVLNWQKEFGVPEVGFVEVDEELVIKEEQEVDMSTRTDGEYTDWFKCPNCNSRDLHDHFNYCPFCSIKLKFDTYYGIKQNLIKNG
jgi:hypothetical protein